MRFNCRDAEDTLQPLTTSDITTRRSNGKINENGDDTHKFSINVHE